MEINSDLIQFRSGSLWRGEVRVSRLQPGFEMGFGFVLVSTKSGQKYQFKVETVHSSPENGTIQSWVCRATPEACAKNSRMENCEIEVFNA